MALRAHFVNQIKYLCVGSARDDERVEAHVDVQLILKSVVNKYMWFLDNCGGKCL